MNYQSAAVKQLDIGEFIQLPTIVVAAQSERYEVIEQMLQNEDGINQMIEKAKAAIKHWEMRYSSSFDYSFDMLY